MRRGFVSLLLPSILMAAPAVGQVQKRPTAPPQPIGAISVYTPESATRTSGTSTPSPVGTGGVPAPAPGRQNGATIVTIGRPTSNDGVWIPYLGEKWISAGSAVPVTPERFRVIGNYEGFPVFARRDTSEQVVYVPTRAGLAAPYRLKQ